MRTVGQILTDARLNKGFSLQQVEKATKIRSKFLRALEADDFGNLPDAVYIQGFIKNYCEFLGLRSNTLLAMFRRQYKHHEQRDEKPIEEPLAGKRWQMTPNKVILGLLILLVLGLFGYFYHQFRLLHQPPDLKVAGPKDDLVVKQTVIEVFGVTDSDATLLVNNEPVLVKEDGRFYKELELSLGTNTILIEAISRRGQKSSVSRKVTRIN